MTNESIADREIVNSRVFDASRETVMAKFTNPQELALWWGPNGFTNKIHEFDLRVGGRWRLDMISSTGECYKNESKFLEVSPERIVFEHLEPVHHFKMTMTFTAQGSQTKLEWRMLFDSADEVTKLKNFILNANEQNFDRLQARLDIAK